METPVQGDKKPKFSALSLVIGMVCGVLLIAVTLLIIKLCVNDRREELDKSSVSSTTQIAQVNSETESETSTAITSTAIIVAVDKTVRLTSDLQYDLNIFLSNFSESDLPNFRMGERLSDEELIQFAGLYNLYNRHNLYEYGDYYDDHYLYGGNMRIEKEHIYETIKKYFDITMKEDVIEDYFYTEFTGGHILEGVSIVNKAEKLENNLYKVSFIVYYTGNNDSEYYSLTADEAEKHYLENYNSDSIIFENVGTGTAIIYAKDINDRSTYILKEYQKYDS